ncbi:MAG: histidine kinase [Bryobacteraceae bacterium]|nr:histidine kinase [Bryobacteraceae bacterium]
MSGTAGLLVPLVQLIFGRGFTLREIFESTVFSLTYSSVIGTLVHVTMLRFGPSISRMKPFTGWVLLLLILVVCAVLGCLAGTVLGVVLTGIPLFRIPRIFSQSVRICIPIALLIGIVSGIIEGIRAQLRATELELRTRELERERAEKLAAEARLSSLESRIHPHFLFNALNSISCLIREDPERAERLIERMAALLRFSLDSNQLGLVPLARELRVVEGYLEIEKARFGDRLHYQITIPEQLSSVEVPPLSIQTLVENSLKFAVSPRREGGIVEVSATLAGKSVEIVVQDDGPGFTLENVVQGHGIDLLQCRLQALFGSDAALTVQGSRVCLQVPNRLPEAAVNSVNLNQHDESLSGR